MNRRPVVLPPCAIGVLRHPRLRDAESLSDTGALHASRQQPIDLNEIGRRDALGVRARDVEAPLVRRVLQVVRLESRKQMTGIAATRNIAGVTGNVAGCQCAMRTFTRDPMRIQAVPPTIERD